MRMFRRWGLPIVLSALAVTAAVVTLVLILSASPSGDSRVDEGCYPGESCYP